MPEVLRGNTDEGWWEEYARTPAGELILRDGLPQRVRRRGRIVFLREAQAEEGEFRQPWITEP